MIELDPGRFAPLIPALRAVPINHLFARSVLERCVDGRAWADRLSSPSLCHVAHPYGMTLLFGDVRAVDAATLREHFDACRRVALDGEIGVETRPEYRRRGYAWVAAARLIGECLGMGLEPVWSCRKENRGSYELACSLGFEPTIDIPYYRLPAAA